MHHVSSPVSQELDVYVPSPHVTSELFNIELPCNVTSHVEDDVTGGFSYTWRWTEDLSHVFDGQMLVINQIRPEQGGMYVCFVTTPGLNPPMTGEAETKIIVQCK